MTYFMKIIFFLQAILLLSCQNKHIDNCNKINWQNIGLQSALKGEPLLIGLEKSTGLCKQAFKTLSHKTFFKIGYQSGLEQYCTTKKGLEEGLKGRIYKNICTKSRSTVFLKGYYKGRLDFLKKSLKKHVFLHTEAADRLWRQEHEYQLTLAKDPEKAKLQNKLVVTSGEELAQLSSKKDVLQDEILKIKVLHKEMDFKN